MAYIYPTDCLGNEGMKETPEGFCVADIYADPDKRWYNQATSEYGTIEGGHFIPYTEVAK